MTAEIIERYADAGAKKAGSPAWRIFILGILGGFLIGTGSIAASTAAFAAPNASAARMASGLLFPFGLGMVILSGAELFTGNCLITVSVLERKASVSGMLGNWLASYAGNFAGGLILALAFAYGGQMEYSGGKLAAYVINSAAGKCNLSFGSAFLYGILCNILVCLGALFAISAKDLPGKVLGAYMPVAFFVICGFEHCVANMCGIPLGLFALQNPKFAIMASESGIDASALTWGGFFFRSLIPVTMGNIFGGVGIGALLWISKGGIKPNGDSCTGQHHDSQQRTHHKRIFAYKS
jgi:formate/nitrite transporter